MQTTKRKTPKNDFKLIRIANITFPLQRRASLIHHQNLTALRLWFPVGHFGSLSRSSGTVAKKHRVIDNAHIGGGYGDLFVDHHPCGPYRQAKNADTWSDVDAFRRGGFRVHQ